MKKTAIILGALATLSTATFALADDVTIINRDTDTTGSIVVKERPVVKKKIIIREQQPDVVIKERRNDPDLVIKGNVDIN